MGFIFFAVCSALSPHTHSSLPPGFGNLHLRDAARLTRMARLVLSGPFFLTFYISAPAGDRRVVASQTVGVWM